MINFAFDGSNDRAPAFFEADTHYHLHARMLRTLSLVNWKRAPACSRHALLTVCEDAAHVVIRWFYDRAPAFMNLGLRRSFIKRRSNMRGSPILIISEYVEIARCHSKSESIRIA